MVVVARVVVPVTFVLPLTCNCERLVFAETAKFVEVALVRVALVDVRLVNIAERAERSVEK